MRAPRLLVRTLLVEALGVALGGCGDPTGGDGDRSPGAAPGSGGLTPAGGVGPGGGAGGTMDSMGGSSGGASSGAGADPTGTGGTLDTGGTASSGGSTSAVEPSGGTSPGGSPSGGEAETGTGGQVPSATGGSAPTGGATETGGAAESGGATAAGAGGAPGGGTSAGAANGGATATGGATVTGGTAGAGGQTGGEERLISFGTLLEPAAVVAQARELARSLADPTSSQWRAEGDQHRSYPFAEADAEEPYRLCVPTDWDGQSELPLVLFLHGAGSDENTYLDQNDQQMVRLAQEHGYVLVSPRGDQGAYGNFLRLTAPFGDEAGAAELMAQVTPESERSNELSEMDVINVLELVLAEYPIDRSAIFLTGHSMGSGGTWYLGGKYPGYWRALAPMSGPFVQESGYPWDVLRGISLFVTEGTQTPSRDASRLLRDWLVERGFDAEYEEVNADHGGMVPLVLPDVFDFFDRARAGG